MEFLSSDKNASVSSIDLNSLCSIKYLLFDIHIKNFKHRKLLVDKW